MDKKEIFEKVPVQKAVFSMALPTILSMIVMILYNMADPFFVGQRIIRCMSPLCRWHLRYF